MPTNKPEVVLPTVPQAFFDEFGVNADDRVMDYGQACYDAGALSADGDFVMVPREATEAMVAAGNEASDWHIRDADDVYRAMLSAAPQQTGQEGEAVASGTPIGVRIRRQPGDPLFDGSEEYEAHIDDLAVDNFAVAMKAKLAEAREKGRGGWNDYEDIEVHLSNLLREHVEKGDPRDVANFCCFLWNRGEGISPATTVAPPPAIDIGKLRELVARWRTEAERLRKQAGRAQRRGNDGLGGAFDALELQQAAQDTEAFADELAALIGDGGEKGNG